MFKVIAGYSGHSVAAFIPDLNFHKGQADSLVGTHLEFNTAPDPSPSQPPRRFFSFFSCFHSSEGDVAAALPKAVSIKVVGVHPRSTDQLPLYVAMSSDRKLAYVVAFGGEFDDFYGAKYVGVGQFEQNRIVVYQLTGGWEGRASSELNLPVPHLILARIHGQDQKLTFLKLIGGGGFGRIAKYVNDQDNFFVIKIPVLGSTPIKELAEKFESEKRLTRGISKLDLATRMIGEVLVPFSGSRFQVLNCGVYHFLEGETYQSLWDTDGPRPLSDLAEQFVFLVQGMQYFHSQKGLAHLDMNSGNLMVTRDNKHHFVDFGSMKPLRNPESQDVEDIVCAPTFLPPELDVPTVVPSYDRRMVDDWQVGELMMSSMLGFNPFSLPRTRLNLFVPSVDKCGPDDLYDRRAILGGYLTQGDLDQRMDRLMTFVRHAAGYEKCFGKNPDLDPSLIGRKDLSDDQLRALCKWIAMFLSPADERKGVEATLFPDSKRINSDFSITMHRLGCKLESFWAYQVTDV